jgi:hypothetical protein
MEFYGVSVPAELFSTDIVHTPRPRASQAPRPVASTDARPASPLEAAARAVASLGALVPGASSEPMASPGVDADDITELREIAASLPPSPGRAPGSPPTVTPEQRLEADAEQRAERPAVPLLRASSPGRGAGVLHERRAEGEESKPKARSKPRNRREAMRSQIAETLGTEEPG